MSGLLLPARNLVQPLHNAAVDDYWLRRKPRSIYLPTSLRPVDVMRRYPVTDTSSTATINTGAVGRVWDFGAGSTTSRIVTPTDSINSIGGVTIVAVIRPTSFAALASICSSLSTAINGLQWRITTSGNLEAVCAGVAVLSTDTAALTVNRWSTVALRILTGSGARSTFATNGIIGASPTTDTTATMNGTGAIGERYTGSSQPFVGQMALLAQFDTLFSDAELRSITAQPWQMFRPVGRRIWVGTSSGAGTISGTSTATLADVTTSAAAALQIQAASTVTLADVSTAGATNLAIAAAGSKTLDDTTSSATGALLNTGASAVTLADVSSSAAGAVQIKASVSVTLADTTASADSDLVITAGSSGQLDNVTLIATGVGTAVNTGTSAVTLADVTGSAAATLTLQAASNVTLADVSTAGATTLYIVAASSKTLDDATSSATGALRNTGAVSVTLADVSLIAAGAAAVPGVFEATPRFSNTARINTARLGYASDAVNTKRLGHTVRLVPARRLGAKTN